MTEILEQITKEITEWKSEKVDIEIAEHGDNIHEVLVCVNYSECNSGRAFMMGRESYKGAKRRAKKIHELLKHDVKEISIKELGRGEF